MSTQVKTTPRISTPEGCPRPSRLATAGIALTLGVAASLAAPPASATGIVVMPGSTAGYLYFPNAAAAAPGQPPAPPPAPIPLAPVPAVPTLPKQNLSLTWIHVCHGMYKNETDNPVEFNNCVLQALKSTNSNPSAWETYDVTLPPFSATACVVEYQHSPQPATCNRVGAIHGLFTSLLGRNPDQKSFLHWFQSPHSIEVIRASIENSPERLCYLTPNKDGFPAKINFTLKYLAYGKDFVLGPHVHSFSPFDLVYFDQQQPFTEVQRCLLHAASLGYVQGPLP